MVRFNLPVLSLPPCGFKRLLFKIHKVYGLLFLFAIFIQRRQIVHTLIVLLWSILFQIVKIFGMLLFYLLPLLFCKFGPFAWLRFFLGNFIFQLLHVFLSKVIA